MALFSRRKKTDDSVAVPDTEVDETPDGVEETADGVGIAPEESAPEINISVQAFRGVGAEAGPEVPLPAETPDVRTPQTDEPRSGASLPDSVTADAAKGGSAPSGSSRPAAGTSAAPARAAQSAPSAPAAAQGTATPVRKLPLAAALPPEQTETVPGMKDNVLLRTALAEIDEGASNEQLIGVLRQTLQGHLYLRVHGDAREQINEGRPLSVGVIRDGDRSFMLAFSSAGAVRDSIQRDNDPTATSAVAQPVTAVLQQVLAGEFTGMIIDNASAPHRVIFPREILQRALEQADVDMTVKSLLAAPRAADSAVRVGEALATTRMWVAVGEGDGSGQPGIAETHTPDGRRFLQLFSHPLEIVALGRNDRPLPFPAEQLAKVLAQHGNLAGVIVDPAGPSILVERDALAPVLVLAATIGD